MLNRLFDYLNVYISYSDNTTYEKIGDVVMDISDQIPFEIPEGWEWCRLGSICNIINGFTPLRTNPDFWNVKDIPWFTIDDIRAQGRRIGKTAQFISKAALGIESKRILPQGTVLLCCTASVGEYAITDIPLTTNQQFNGLVIKEEYKKAFWSEFLFKYAETFKNILLKMAGKTTFNFISVSKVSSILIPLPPLSEQHRIVKKIEELLPCIERYDEAEQKLTSLNAEFPDKLKKSILQMAVQGKLVPQDSTDKPASVLLDKIRTEKEDLIKQGKIKRDKNESVIYRRDNEYYEKQNGVETCISEQIPFEIPEGWEWCRLGGVVEINPRNKIEDDVSVSFIPMTLITEGYHNLHTSQNKLWKDVKSGYTHFATNDVAFAKITPCFENRKSVILKNLSNGYGAGTTELHILRVYNDLIFNEYLLWFCKSAYFIDNGVKAFSGTAGQQRVGKEYVSTCLFPLPPLSEQHRIVQKIEELLPLSDKLT